MIKIALVGANGKMGQVISRMAAESEEVKIVCGIDINTQKNFDYPVYESFDNATEEIDVIIDFSHPNSLLGTLSYATNHEKPAVIATTGLTDENKECLNAASKKIPIFFSANMSLGVNLIIELAKKATQILKGFDIEIIEKHHNQKLDAPSGTALAIADAINESLVEPSEYIYDRHSSRKKRSKNEIGMHAVRGGTIVGEHDVLFAGCDEIIEIKHTATSREIFASGALSAAIFMYGKKRGMYSMSDLIKGE